MRVLALVQALGDGDPVAWVEALASIIARAHLVDDPDALATVECITHATADESLPYATRQTLYTTAVELNLPAIARLFIVASPPAELPHQLKKQLGPERPLRPADRPLTLGHGCLHLLHGHGCRCYDPTLGRTGPTGTVEGSRSTRVIFLTEGYLRISRTARPSPPPRTSTERGEGTAARPGCTRAS